MTEVAFEIDGRKYPWPGLVSLTMRECRIFHEETGTVWESLWIDNLELSDVFKTPGFISAMARIAYVREHPDLPDEAVKLVIEKQPALSLFSTAAAAFAPEPSEDPKATGTPDVPETSSSATSSEPSSTPNGTNDQPSTSGKSSERTSGQPDSSPDAIGTGGSATPSTVPPPRSVI